ncbi:MAG: hypothetical protein AB1633_05490 [Elusimicrobiota bacterium]
MNCEGSLFKQSVVKLQAIIKIYRQQSQKSSGTSSEPDMGQLKRNKQGERLCEQISRVYGFTNEKN